MTRITVADDLRKKLLGLVEPVALCDETGKILGNLFPVLTLADCDPSEPPISEEEFQRRENSDEPGSTPDEILERLRKLP